LRISWFCTGINLGMTTSARGAAWISEVIGIGDGHAIVYIKAPAGRDSIGSTERTRCSLDFLLCAVRLAGLDKIDNILTLG